MSSGISLNLRGLAKCVDGGLPHLKAHTAGALRIAADEIERLQAVIGGLDERCATYERQARRLAVDKGEIDEEARFLLDRLDEYDPEDEDHVRDFYGHVSPSISRLRRLVGP